MSLLGKLPTTPKDKMRKRGGEGNTWPSTESIDRLIGWLVSRQTSVLQEEDSPEPEGAVAVEGTQPPSTDSEADQDGATPEDSTIEPLEEELRIAGISGRCNKAADTCYAFWAGGSLMMLGSLDLIDQDALSRYLLSETQHQIGGFGKLPGDPPGKVASFLHNLCRY
ncbi:MAG: hypothetical protein Q9193_000449 [Seirophora villosa]